ncbi:MAG: T3SS effector HopA1 family protein [Actinomycetota bacterium]
MMQLLDVRPKQPLDTLIQQLIAIKDIAKNVEIHSNFCIRHPDYKPLELPDEVVSRFQQLPLNLQHKFLHSQLCSFLYGVYYNGGLRAALALDAEAIDSTRLQNLENNTFLGVDVGFYDRLHSSNSGEGYFDPGWQVIGEQSDRTLVVKKNELTLHIERDRHLAPSQATAILGDWVALRMPRNIVQNGFYMAVGNLGQYSSTAPDRQQQLVRVYFNISPEGAVTVMASLTKQLNAISIPFCFKALYNPKDYGRYDTAVLYFEKHNYPTIRQVLQSIYAESQLHFGEEVPLFTKSIAPGLAVAEEPNRKFSAQESFGLNRCHIVANSLLEARQKGDESKVNRMVLILEKFAQQEVDLQYPYLNPGSQDIYTSLEQ